jgi:tryptophan-rich sensory protein
MGRAVAQGYLSSRRSLIVAAGIALATAMIGGGVTDVGPWYRALVKPWFQPPDWLFAPAWTIIFALCAVAGAFAYDRARSDGERRLIVGLFLLNAVLNVSWSILFFAVKRPDWAAIEVVFLWASVLSILVVSWRVDRRAGLCLVPYLAWVTFAAILTFAIVGLNPRLA